MIQDIILELDIMLSDFWWNIKSFIKQYIIIPLLMGLVAFVAVYSWVSVYQMASN